MKNVGHFDEFVKECSTIQRALSLLPNVCTDSVFAAWEAGGIFAPDWGSRNHTPQFTGEHLNRWWASAAAHSSVAAVLGYRLADRCNFSDVNIENVVQAILVHDWNKRQEVEYSRQKGHDVGKLHSFALTEHAQLLKWFPATVVNLVGAAGHGGVYISESRELSIEEEIVYYADMCTSCSTVTTYLRRFQNYWRRAQWGATVSGEIEAYFHSHYGVSHVEKQVELLVPIERKFSDKIGYTGQQENLPRHLVPEFPE